MPMHYILSPSFAGATEEYRFAMNYRNQWPAVPGVFHTYSISFDKAMPNFNSGIGVLATYDVAGSGNLSTTNIGLLYSYDFNINRNGISGQGLILNSITLDLISTNLFLTAR